MVARSKRSVRWANRSEHNIQGAIYWSRCGLLTVVPKNILVALVIIDRIYWICVAAPAGGGLLRANEE